MHDALFTPFTLGDLQLRNRVVMAPLTRSRAIDNVPNELMAEYYGQRASAGLIISEGTSPSPNGLGYPRIPGLFSEAQTQGWRATTKAVHDRGGAIFAQLMHTGRVGHPLNLPKDAQVLAPSALAAPGQMYTDQGGPQDHPSPKAMSQEDINATVREYVVASENAIAAGFDGVELHGANGYLIDQFLNPNANERDDGYGGSIEARARFALEVAQATVNAIGKQRVGIRLSPFNPFNGLGDFEGAHDAFVHTAKALSELGLVYLHLADMSPMAGYEFPEATRTALREAFNGALILNGDFDGAKGADAITQQRGDLIAYGRPYVSNPDVVERLHKGAEFNAPQQETFYTPGPKGYTDYPTLS